MDMLEKLKEITTSGHLVPVIPEYKCRKCGTIFLKDPILYPFHQSYYTCLHSDCHIFTDCPDYYIGVADLQGFEVME